MFHRVPVFCFCAPFLSFSFSCHGPRSPCFCDTYCCLRQASLNRAAVSDELPTCFIIFQRWGMLVLKAAGSACASP